MTAITPSNMPKTTTTTMAKPASKTTTTASKTTTTIKTTTTSTPPPITLPTASATIPTSSKMDSIKLWLQSSSPFRRHMITCSFIMMMIVLLYLRHTLISSSSETTTDINDNMNNDDQISSSIISTPTTKPKIPSTSWGTPIIKEEEEKDDDDDEKSLPLSETSVKDDVMKLASTVIHNTQTTTTKIASTSEALGNPNIVDPKSSIEFKNKAKAFRNESIHTSKQQCNKVSPIYNTTLGKPIWMPGYPGSGYHIIEHIIPRIIGYNALVVYYHHTCDNIVVPYTIPTKNDLIGHDEDDETPKTTSTTIAAALCITHWPFIGRDSPKDIEKKDTEKYIKNQESSNILLDPNTIQNNMKRYHHHVLFVIRNPMYCISSYYTRWYGNQNNIRHNHIQPPINEWKKWRNSKVLSQLLFWKNMIIQWHDSIDDTSTNGIGMYLPYELLIDMNQGPILLQSITKYMKDANHSVNNNENENENEWTIEDYQCIWNNTIDLNHYSNHKEYIYSYTIEQQNIFIQTLDDIISLYPTDDVLIQLLQYYRNIILSDMIID